jgi:hypothetical protein
MKCSLLLLAGFALWAQQPPLDLDAVRAEPRADKRYEKALDFASEQITEARKQYQDGKFEQFRNCVGDVIVAVKLCDQTLRGTGKNPSKSPKHFKRAEMRMREILRRLTGLEQDVSVEDRNVVTKAKSSVQEIHDNLLFDIMGRRK